MSLINDPSSYICPKCGGGDFYFGKKQIIIGLGGIYGNRQKEVLRAFCRVCDIEGILRPEVKKSMSKAQRPFLILAIVLFVFIGISFLLPF